MAATWSLLRREATSRLEIGPRRPPLRFHILCWSKSLKLLTLGSRGSERTGKGVCKSWGRRDPDFHFLLHRRLGEPILKSSYDFDPCYPRWALLRRTRRRGWLASRSKKKLKKNIFFLWRHNAISKKISLKVRIHPKESADTLFLKIHQQMAELQRLPCKNPKIENRLVPPPP